MIARDADEMRKIGQRLGSVVAAGDLIMLTGPLGAGKTTFVQGLADGMGVEGRVTSPTFVISHVHNGPIDLVHVDAYRLESLDDVDALDLDASLDHAVTVIEWGRGKTDQLSDDRLEIVIERPTGGDAGLNPEDLYDEAPRYLTVTGTGQRSRALAEEMATWQS